ncbi:MAG: inositol monophosphatase family protein [Fimbriimonadaceae bacterium]
MGSAPLQLSARCEAAIAVSLEVGLYLQDRFANLPEVKEKQDGSPVTEADQQAEATFRALLSERFPRDGFWGEESGGSEQSQVGKWICDPIDGTKSFIAGVPLFGSLLAWLPEGNEKPSIGVAGFPALDRLVFAEIGKGCHTNEGTTLTGPVARPLQDALICHGSIQSFEKAGMTGAFLEISQKCRSSRGWGDAFGHLLVAEGKADAMIDPIVAYWDIAALIPIAEEAGCCLDYGAHAGTVHSFWAVTSAPSLRGELLFHLGKSSK